MEMLTLDIPHEFITARLGQLSWPEVLVGLENRLLDIAAVADFAADALSDADPPAEVVELAIADRDEPVLPKVQELAAREPSADIVTAKRAWLYLALAWLYEHRDELPDPLESVEMVYAEFDYPEDVAGFVRYMPATEPDLGDRAGNEARLIEKWGRFLEEERASLSAR